MKVAAMLVRRAKDVFAELVASHAASVEARLANLQNEIQKLRTDAHAEMTRESERIRRETEHHVQRIREQSVQELELMTRAAKDELRDEHRFSQMSFLQQIVAQTPLSRRPVKLRRKSGKQTASFWEYQHGKTWQHSSPRRRCRDLSTA